MDDAVGRNTIRNTDSGEAVDLDTDEASVARYVDRKRFPLEEGLEVDLSRDVSNVIDHLDSNGRGNLREIDPWECWSHLLRLLRLCNMRRSTRSGWRQRGMPKEPLGIFGRTC